jgi:glycogen operon protein
LVLHADGAPITITLPGLPYSASYFPVLDTSTPTGEPALPATVPIGQPLEMPGRTVWLLRAER